MSEMTNEQKFFSIYVEELKKEITKDNSSYAYGIDQAEEVGLRMVRALKEKSANLSNPIKRTAKKKTRDKTYNIWNMGVSQCLKSKNQEGGQKATN